MINLYEEKKNKQTFNLEWFKSKFSFLTNGNSLFYYALFVVIVGLLFHISAIWKNDFTAFWSGDYNMQYVPFAYNYYDEWMKFFKTGVFPYWDSNIFLGADSVTSNGYYILFSPFFVPLLITPRAWIPQMLMVITLMRMMLAALLFRLYLKKINVKEKFARLGGVAYAFCGFVAYNMWFNNFLDIVVILAIILWGIEIVLKDKKPWVLAIGIGMMGVDNFFFFPAIVIMTCVYSIFRYFVTLKGRDVKTAFIVLGVGIAGYLMGVLIGTSLLIPGLITGMSDPKIEAESYLTLLKESLKEGNFAHTLALLFDWSATPNGEWKTQTYPIIELFYPPVTCRHISLLYKSSFSFDNNAGSIWIGLGLLIFLLPAIIQALREERWSVIVGIAIICIALFTPFSYFLLFGGGKAYARWQVMIPPVLIAFIVSYLSKNHKKITVPMLSVGVGFVLCGIFVGAVLAHCYVNYNTGYVYFWDFPMIPIIEVLYVLALYIILIFVFRKGTFAQAMLYVASFEAALVGIFVTQGHSIINYQQSNGGPLVNEQMYDVTSKIQDIDKTFYRMSTSTNVTQRSVNNQNLNDFNGVSMFNTLYNYNTQRFKHWSRLSDWYGGWSAGYFEKRQSLDQFLGIKYYAFEHNLLKDDWVKRPNYPFGFNKDVSLSNKNIDVYKNDSINSIGYVMDEAFTFDNEGKAPDPLNKYDEKFSESHDYVYEYSMFTPLRAEEMYLDTAIMDKKDYDKLSDEFKADVPEVELRSLNDISAKELMKNDYKLTFYHNRDGVGHTSSSLHTIPQDKDKYPIMSSNEINKIRTKNDGKTYIFLTSKDENTPIKGTENGGAIYLNLSFNEQHKYSVYLLDKDGKCITYDQHLDAMFYKFNNKAARAYYSNEPVYSIVIYPRAKHVNTRVKAYIEPKPIWENRLSSLKTFDDVKYVDWNTFTFKSNLEQNRLGVANIPFERGWNVYAKKQGETEYKKLDTFLAQGGFVGFAMEKGPCEYAMRYKNPDFSFAMKFARIGTGSLLASYCIYVAIKQHEYFKKAYISAKGFDL